HRLGAPAIDAEDARVRVLRAQHHRVGLALDAEIVAEAAAAGGEPLVLLADDGPTDEAEAHLPSSRFLVEVGHRGRLSAFLDQLPFRSNHMRTSCSAFTAAAWRN